MKNSNIIISVIIVVCIAGGVGAYTLTNPDGNIFTLPGYTSSDDSDTSSDLGKGDTNDNAGDSDTSSDLGKGDTNDNAGDSDTSSDLGKGDTNDNARSSSNTENGGNRKKPDNPGNSKSSKISPDKAKEIVNKNYIGEPGCYAGTPTYDKKNNWWIVPVLDKDGKQVGEIYINAKTGANEGGAGGG